MAQDQSWNDRDRAEFAALLGDLVGPSHTRRTRQSSGSKFESLPKLRLQLFVEFSEVDNHPLMHAGSDLLSPIFRLDPKFDSPSFALGHFRVSSDTPALASRRSMNNVDMDADSTFAGVEVRLDGVERSVLHHHDHDGRRKNWRQHRILETICEVVRSHDETKRAFDANGYRLHVTPQLSALNPARLIRLSGPAQI